MILNIMFVIWIYLWLSVKPSYSQKNVVDMQELAFVNFNLVDLTPCTQCIIPKSIYKIFLLVCSIKSLDNENFIRTHLNRFSDWTNEVSTQTCGSYDDSAVITNITIEKEFECGPYVQKVVDSDELRRSAIEESFNFPVQEWDGSFLIMAIVALTDGNCTIKTLLTYLKVHEIETFSNISAKAPIPLILQGLETKYLPEDELSKLDITISVHCPELFHLKGCWYKCINNHLHTCNNDDGSQTCTYGWVIEGIEYIDKIKLINNKLSMVTILECERFDICLIANCTYNCVATGNSTFICSFTLTYEPLSSFLLPGDKVRCSSDTANSTTTWRYTTTDPNYKNTETNIEIRGDTLYVLPRATPSFNNIMICSAMDEKGVITINETRNYTIIMHPTMIGINVTLQHVYLGDSIECVSNAWPTNLFVYSFDVVTNNFKPAKYQRYDNIISVPRTATLGEMILNSSIEFVDINGTTAVFFRVFRMYIYAFRQFKWMYKTKEWYQIDDAFTVFIDIGVLYTLKIIQISGPSFIEESFDNVIHFNEGCKGGSYQFLASLYILVYDKFISFHQRFEATLLGQPTYIRFSHIIGYPNEKILCLVDGYPDRFIQIFFVIRDSSGEYIKSTKLRHLKVPSDATLNSTYLLNCEYNMDIENTTYFDNVDSSFTIKPRTMPFMFVNYYPYLRLICLLVILAYAFFQFFITMTILSNIRILCYGLNFDYVYKTFILYNRFRKNVRYDEKMNHISNIILDIQKTTGPGEKLILDTFFKYLKKTYRHSYTPGFAIVPADFPARTTSANIGINTDNIPDDKSDIKSIEDKTPIVPKLSFYGIGTRPTEINTRVLI